MDLSQMSESACYSKRFNRIFVIEMMERFGFYAFNTIIVMYFVMQFNLPKSTAYSLFGAFSALLYIFIPIGGWVGDSYLGTKRTIILGGLVLLAGYIILASSMSIELVYLGMATIVVGNGLFKSNPASLLSKIIKRGDIAKRDSAYSIYYMSINVGSVASQMISPFVAHKFGWQYGFGVAALGLVVGIVNFYMGKKYFKGVASKADELKFSFVKLALVLVVSVVVIAICSFLLNYVTLTNYIMLGLVSVGFLFFFILGLKQKKGDRAKMIASLVLIAMAIIFYSLYNQMFTSLTFFGAQNTVHTIFGIPVYPEQYQLLNPATVMIFAPILAMVYRWQGRRNKNMKMTTKFTLGLLISSFAFLILVPSMYFSNGHGIISSNWIVAAFFVISIGELLVAALGASMVSQLVPEKFMGFAIGMWFVAMAMAGVTGALIANMTQPSSAPMTSVQSLPVYCHAFLLIGLMTLCATVLMFVVKLILDKYIYTGNEIAA